MGGVQLVLLIAALTCFIVATFGVGSRLNLLALGWALVTLSWLLPGLDALT